MSRQSLLLTAHKGVDLHAATALRVMRDRLEGGAALRGLFRCEMHALRADAAGGWTMPKVLDTARYYNPNKHHYGVFEGAAVEALFAGSGGAGTQTDRRLPAGWPGRVVGSDLAIAPDELYDVLLGGPPAEGLARCDVLAFARGQEGPLVSGVLWGLLLQAGADEAAELGSTLAVARGRKQGLLLNPHMEDWLLAVREEHR